MKSTMNVAIIGTKFMGKAHSNAWLNAPHFFDMEIKPILKVAVGTDKAGTEEFAHRWGWEEVSTDWEAVVARDDIDIIDISTPTYLHHDMALAAAAARKHIFLEKPFALNLAQAQAMYKAVLGAGITHYVNHNYRRAPAVRLARMLDRGGIHWPHLPLARRLSAGLDRRPVVPANVASARRDRRHRTARRPELSQR